MFLLYILIIKIEKKNNIKQPKRRRKGLHEGVISIGNLVAM